MNKIILIALITLTSLTTFADSRPSMSDGAECEAATLIAKSISKKYISSNLYCSRNTDCSEVNYAGGPMCGSKMVNNVGLAGYRIMLKNPEYRTMVNYIELNRGSCGPIGLCSPRPAGEVKCVSNKCKFVADRDI